MITEPRIYHRLEGRSSQLFKVSWFPFARSSQNELMLSFEVIKRRTRPAMSAMTVMPKSQLSVVEKIFTSPLRRNNDPMKLGEILVMVKKSIWIKGYTYPRREITEKRVDRTAIMMAAV